MIYGREGSSAPQRVFLVAAQTAILAVAAWLLVGGGLATLNRWFGWALTAGAPGRRGLLLGFCLVTYARLTFTALYLLRRAIGWEEAISVSAAFAVYYLGFGLLGGTRERSLDAVDAIATMVFLAGAFINTYAEILRRRWLDDPRHRGRFYTGGLFRYARHVNYFGDIVWVSGFALATRNPWSALVPVLLLAFFAFYNAPELDRHLETKYPEEFAEYRRDTAMLIPFVY